MGACASKYKTIVVQSPIRIEAVPYSEEPTKLNVTISKFIARYLEPTPCYIKVKFGHLKRLSSPGKYFPDEQLTRWDFSWNFEAIQSLNSLR